MKILIVVAVIFLSGRLLAEEVSVRVGEHDIGQFYNFMLKLPPQNKSREVISSNPLIVKETLILSVEEDLAFNIECTAEYHNSTPVPVGSTCLLAFDSSLSTSEIKTIERDEFDPTILVSEINEKTMLGNFLGILPIGGFKEKNYTSSQWVRIKDQEGNEHPMPQIRFHCVKDQKCVLAVVKL